MTGLLLFAVVGFWVALCRWLSRVIARWAFPRHPRRDAIRFSVFLILLPLIVIDELTAIPEFRRVCSEYAVLVKDREEQVDTAVWFGDSQSQDRSFGLLAGAVQRRQYVVAGTRTPAFHYHSVSVRGGILIRTLGISQANRPLILDSPCAPPELPELERWLKAHGMHRISRPIHSSGGNK